MHCQQSLHMLLCNYGGNNMQRTTIMLPDDLKKMAEREAMRRGASLGEIIRTALKELLQPKKHTNKKDSLFSDSLIYKGPVEKDLSQNHDNYLY
jgi:metal-responsive CopG/Arc/MetJ family transcriptional regulator